MTTSKTQQKRERIALLKNQAKQGDLEAQVKLASCYEKGIDVKQSDWCAGIWYRKAAEQGHAFAQFKMGEWYYYGLSPVEYNEKMAIRWFKKAAKQGYLDAQFGLFCAYRFGHQIENTNDYYLKEACKWLEMAAKRGHAEAQFFLGNALHLGEYYKKDMRKALEWYHKAARQNESSAVYLLAYLYVKGEEVKQNYAKALQLLEEAKRQNDSRAFVWLGCLAYFGMGLEQDYVKAVQYFDAAAEDEELMAYRFLGHCYFHGLGVEKDLQQALKWFVKYYSDKRQKYYDLSFLFKSEEPLDELKKRAEQGDTIAQYEYAIACLDENPKEAIKRIKLLANQDDEFAQQYLGYCYYAGLGDNRNDEKAVMWFDKASIHVLQPDRIFENI